ncbi:MAG TPA: glutaredoxin family protein [Actinomycetota bacterium]|nr:glutaredoxin family protein [Actinomycetota bacterium]
MREVLLYSRPRCGLCDEARGTILAVRDRVPFTFREIDITGDDALELEYGIRIPVVLVDGDELAEIRVGELELEEAVGR